MGLSHFHKRLNQMTLASINRRLSELEHHARVMHRMQTLDSSYVETSESIHRLHKSLLKRTNDRTSIASSDDVFLQSQYKRALALYQNDDLEVEHALLYPICRKLVTGEYNTSNELMIMFLCGYNAVTARLGLIDEFTEHTEHLILQRKSGDETFDAYCNKMYALMLLQSHRYSLSAPYVPYLQPVSVSNLRISPSTSSFESSPNAPASCILIYFSGGIGDKIMFARLVEPLVIAFPQHTYVILVDDSLLWIFRQVWKSLSNVRIVPYSQRGRIPSFKHHMNINTLVAHLGVTYETIPTASYMHAIETRETTGYDASIRKMLHATKRNVIINWLGTCNAQVVNRSIQVAELEPLLTKTSDYIHWIAICTADLYPNDVDMLKKWNVTIPNDQWDRDHSFVDSIALMRMVDLVLSVDTSSLHIAGSIGVPTWGMLVVGCDWRWKSSNDTSNWYPKIRLFRQTCRRVWADVLSRIEIALKTDFG